MFTAKLVLLLNVGLSSLILLITLLLARGSFRIKLLGGICVGFSVIVFVAPLSILVGMNIDVFIAFLYIKKKMLHLFTSSYFLFGLGQKKKEMFLYIYCVSSIVTKLNHVI